MGKYFSYSFYEKNLQKGELWIRSSSGAVRRASEVLANVFLKYKISDPVTQEDYDTLDFYQDLVSDTGVLRFDVMQDVLFLENNRGCIFDQITLENNIIKPLTQDNNFITSAKRKRLGFPDYWFDELNRKIYIAANVVEDYSASLKGLKMRYTLELFDMNSSILDLKYDFSLHFDFGTENYYRELPIIEPVKITYNKDTKLFNLSHILRGPKKQFGIVSINILKDQNLNVKSVNAFLPFGKTADVNYDFVLQKLLNVDSDLN